MDEQQLAPYIQEISQALNGTRSREDILSELKQYLSFGIVLKEAKRSMIKKYGGTVQEASPRVIRKIRDIQPSDGNMEFVAKILSVDHKEVNVRGAQRTIMYGILGDETGHCPFTSWGDWELGTGEIIRVRGAYSKEFRGELQVNFGNSTMVEKVRGITFDDLDVDKIAPLGSTAPRDVKVGELRAGMGTVVITAKVLTLSPRVIGRGDKERTIYGGKMADETGRISYTAWNDLELKEGDVIRVEGAYVKEWKGLPQLNFDERCNVIPVTGSTLSEIAGVEERSVTISDLMGLGTGAEDISVEGLMLDIRAPSGLIFRCPECRKALREGVCNVHGKVEPIPDLRIKGTLDDGTGALSLILKRDPTGKILGMSVEGAVEHARNNGGDSVIQEILEKKLLDRTVKITGNVIMDDFGMTLIGEGIELIDEDVGSLVGALLAEIEREEV